MAKITVQNTQITVVSIDERDYISLTDMVRNIENGLALIEKWLRNKNTIEFLGIWESMYNPNFNSPEFEGIKNAAGLNRFILSVKQWVEKTNSRGIIAKAGRYGGTYAHKDISQGDCPRVMFLLPSALSHLFSLKPRIFLIDC